MKLSKLILQTAQHEGLKKFYTKILELPVKEIDDNCFVIHTHDSELIFTKAVPGINPVYHFAFNIPYNKLDEALHWLQNRVSLLWLDDYKSYIANFTNWHARSIYFLDFAGNIVEFIARFDLNDVVDEPFSSAHIRNVSEIGLVFPANSFDNDIKLLMEQYKLSYFDKQPPLPQFRAIGDDEGLFVIVPENKVWFSTKDTTAGIFPMHISFTQNNTFCQLDL
jgi:hypothetical protein